MTATAETTAEIGSNESIASALRLLHEPGDVFEIRALDVPQHRGRPFIKSGYFNDLEKAAYHAGMCSIEKAAGVYVTANPVDPALLARANNRMQSHPRHATGDADITRVRYFQVDIDPVRPSGIAASDEEQQQSRAVANAVEEFLAAKGWPLPIIMSTGNGYTLLYRVDLPNEPATKALFADMLKVIDSKMREQCGERATVDQAVCNPARLIRVKHTYNRKGDDTAERPHRMVEMFEPPEPIETVSIELLQKVAAMAPVEVNDHHASQPATAGRATTGRPRLDVARWLTDNGVPFQIGTTGDGRDKFQLRKCVNKAEHNGTSACFMQDAAGKPSYKCQHTSCANIGWQQAKQLVGPPDPNHYDPPLGSPRFKATASDTLPPGTKVKAADRNNIGEVVRDDGNTVAVHFVSPEGAAATVDIPRNKLRLANGSSITGERIYSPELLTSAQFDSGEYNQRFLIKQLMVARESMMLGGKMKVCKTSIAIDMCVSLGSGTPFLGTFETVKARPAILSGESGPYTIRNIARRVSQARGLRLADVDAVWGFQLPQIARESDLDALAEIVERHSIEVLIIDPAYLCMLAGTEGKQASNLFDMGPILLGLTDVAQWTDATIVLLHHCRKNSTEAFAPPELDELSMAGFAEWARQWVLLGRREAFEQGSGAHKLWMNIGGSAGHSGCWAVDINEGALDDNFGSRKWEVEVKRTSDAKREAREASTRRKAEEQERREEGYRSRLLSALQKSPQGETSRALRELSGLNGPNFGTAIRMLIAEGRARTCPVVKGTRQYEGFQPTGK